MALILLALQVRNPVYPKKPPRFFRPTQSFETDSTPRTLSITSMNESFTNLKNSSLDSIDEMSSLKVFTNNTDSCFNSHYNESKSRDHSNLQSSSSTSIHLLDSTSLSTLPKANALFQNQSCALSGLMLSRSMSISPQSPRDVVCQETSSPNTGMQSDFSTDEYYIDESMPSSVGTGNSQGSEFVRQLDTANIVIAMLQVSVASLFSCPGRFTFFFYTFLLFLSSLYFLNLLFQYSIHFGCLFMFDSFIVEMYCINDSVTTLSRDGDYIIPLATFSHGMVVIF